MNYAIKMLKTKKAELEIEKRIWSGKPNIIRKITKEIKSLDEALLALNPIINEFIICAAIKHKDTGKIYLGHRHNHCLEASNGELSWKLNREEISKIKRIQGFITNKNRFVDRIEALTIALANNQVLDKKQIRGNELYSEDLY